MTILSIWCIIYKLTFGFVQMSYKYKICIT